jgi:beta-glucosidase
MSTVRLPEVSPASLPRTPEALLALMTREEKADLLAGIDDWHFHGVPRLDIPSIRVTDCGHGVTLCGTESSPATCFPTGIGMAATWNVELLELAGRAIGRETRALGCSILLGPKINLHRHPLNGRSFETFSEDPWLAGLLGAAVIRGIQSEGVGSCVKAMAANNQQRTQEKVSSEVDEQTLREIYLRAFELAIEEGEPCSIMTAYNRLNGHYCSESPWLIQKIIKDEWNFPGFVVSDWRAVHGPEVYASGLDLEMPGPGKFLNQRSVLRALDEGLLTEYELDDKALRILRTLLRFGAEEADTMGRRLDTSENREAALRVAEEGIVLLKNDGGILPLDRKSVRRILVTGPNAAEARLGGGGSASVTPFYTISPLAGIREICGEDIEVRFLEGCSLVGSMETITDHFEHEASEGETRPGLLAEFFNTPDTGDTPDAAWTVPQVDFSWGWASPGAGVFRGSYSVRFTGRFTPPVTGRYRLGVFAQEGCVRLSLDGEQLIEAWDDARNGNFEEQYQTRYLTTECDLVAGKPVAIELAYGKRAARAGVRLEWEIPGSRNRLERVLEEAQAADAVIVCGGLSNLFEGGGSDRSSIDIPAPQRELIERVAAVNPRTIVALNSGGVLALPWADAVPSILQCWYPGQEGGRALARILFGEANPSGHLPDTIPHRLEDHAAVAHYPGDGVRVCYEEGRYIGYRHFQRTGIAPHFPFGFGLSYTDFTFSTPSLSTSAVTAGSQIEVTVRVKNTGMRAGKAVVQLYVRLSENGRARPESELRAFRKVQLEAAEETVVKFAIGARELKHFDVMTGDWLISPGSYEILTGPHSGALEAAALEIL